MKNKYPVKICLLVILVIAFAFCSFGCSGKSEKLSYDDKLVQMGKEAYEVQPNWNWELDSLSYENGVFTAEINGEEIQMDVPDYEGNLMTLIGTEKVTDKKLLKIVDSAKKLLNDYIESSNILTDKEELKSRINSVEAFYTECDVDAAYDDGTIFINHQNAQYVCQWMVVHELVHALCEFTNGGTENELYPYSIFNEIMTDLITMTMDPEFTAQSMSGYMAFYDLVLPYIGKMGYESIQAYFYGYDGIYDRAGKDEFNFYVVSLDYVYYSKSQAGMSVG